MNDLDGANPAIRRLCIAVAFDQAHTGGKADQRAEPQGLSDVLDDACRDAPLDRALWHCQPQGDGELAILPPGVDEGYVIGHFIREAGQALQFHNKRVEQGPRLRLRIAFHQGLTYVVDSGYMGPAVAAICGLLDSPQLTDALLNNLAADLAVIVSQPIFEEVVLHDGHDLRATEFVPAQIADPNETRLTAWIRVPGREYNIRPARKAIQRMRKVE